LHSSEYDFHLVIRDEPGTVLHRAIVNDFLPCYEDLLFAGVLDGTIPNDGSQPNAWVEPVGDVRRVAGIKMSLNGHSKTYGVQVFANRVREVLLSKERLKDSLELEGNAFWHVEAEQRSNKQPARRLAVAVKRRPYPLLDRCVTEYGIEGAGQSENALDVFVAGAVLDKLRQDAAESLDCERASFLTGQLVRARAGHAAVIIQGQIPAAVETTASKVHVSFSPLTFQAARKELESRRDGGEIVAWAHNHPPTCGRECLMKVPACATDTVFFSSLDRVLHRASFPAAYMVALVVGKGADRRADDPMVRAYGWRDAVIEERPFQVY
jgi:hypothetical protein